MFLDTGTSLSLLPWTLVASIARQFPSAQWDDSIGLYRIDCTVESQQATLDFGFGGGHGSSPAWIRVPFREAVYRIDPSSACYLGFIPVAGPNFIIGDTVLRAAYALFRQDEKAVYLAQFSDQGCGPTNVIQLDWTVKSMPLGTCSQPNNVPVC